MNDEFKGFIDEYALNRTVNRDNVYLSRVLKPLVRIEFNPESSSHREAYARFRLTGKWTINFYAEWPNVDVPTTIQRKITEWACKKEFDKVKKQLK